MKGVYERLQNLSHKLSSELYAKGKAGAEGAQAEGASTEEGSKGNDDVIEADYKDVP